MGELPTNIVIGIAHHDYNWVTPYSWSSMIYRPPLITKKYQWPQVGRVYSSCNPKKQEIKQIPGIPGYSGRSCNLYPKTLTNHKDCYCRMDILIILKQLITIICLEIFTHTTKPNINYALNAQICHFWWQYQGSWILMDIFLERAYSTITFLYLQTADRKLKHHHSCPGSAPCRF